MPKLKWTGFFERNLASILLVSITLVVGLVLLIMGFPCPSADSPNCVSSPNYWRIGLPVLFSVSLYLWILFCQDSSHKPIWTKSGLVWVKFPYSVWVLKCLLRGAYIYLFILLGPFVGVFTLVKSVLKHSLKIVQILFVASTVPDGKAESKIKQIWKGNSKP
jgi:hypothetical protein